MKTATIHIDLPEEAVDCWFPVQAEHLGGDRYRILEEPQDDPVLQFHKGEVVRCRQQSLLDGVTPVEGLVAYELA